MTQVLPFCVVLTASETGATTSMASLATSSSLSKLPSAVPIPTPSTPGYAAGKVSTFSSALVRAVLTETWLTLFLGPLADRRDHDDLLADRARHRGPQGSRAREAGRGHVDDLRARAHCLIDAPGEVVSRQRLSVLTRDGAVVDLDRDDLSTRCDPERLVRPSPGDPPINPATSAAKSSGASGAGAPAMLPRRQPGQPAAAAQLANTPESIRATLTPSPVPSDCAAGTSRSAKGRFGVVGLPDLLLLQFGAHDPLGKRRTQGRTTPILRAALRMRIVGSRRHWLVCRRPGHPGGFQRPRPRGGRARVGTGSSQGSGMVGAGHLAEAQVFQGDLVFDAERAAPGVDEVVVRALGRRRNPQGRPARRVPGWTSWALDPVVHTFGAGVGDVVAAPAARSRTARREARASRRRHPGISSGTALGHARARPPPGATRSPGRPVTVVDRLGGRGGL